MMRAVQPNCCRWNARRIGGAAIGGRPRDGPVVTGSAQARLDFGGLRVGTPRPSTGRRRSRAVSGRWIRRRSGTCRGGAVRGRLLHRNGRFPSGGSGALAQQIGEGRRAGGSCWHLFGHRRRRSRRRGGGGLQRVGGVAGLRDGGRPHRRLRLRRVPLVLRPAAAVGARASPARLSAVLLGSVLSGRLLLVGIAICGLRGLGACGGLGPRRLLKSTFFLFAAREPRPLAHVAGRRQVLVVVFVRRLRGGGCGLRLRLRLALEVERAFVRRRRPAVVR
mmetsp:Transcript_7692/g.24015  ORF Transcript_7692/g.24015 Transcript_7692/m.24015 type:complete len:277 (-) Transcript_7692:2045-2875(-)